MKNFFNEFKKFIERGNVIDMAVGVVIGGAFQAIVTSLVNDVIMPLVAIVTSNNNFSELKIVTKSGAIIAYGNFIQSIVNFLLIALVIFIFVSNMNKLRDKNKKKDEIVEEPAPDSDELVTLKEIRDLLKNK